MGKYRVEFTLNGLPATTNSMGRAHWAVKAKEANNWKTQVCWKIKEHGGPLKPLEVARLTLTRFSSNEPDPDGLVSSFKHVIDGLVEACVLKNDKISNIGMPDYRWVKCRRGQGSIQVIVEEFVKP